MTGEAAGARGGELIEVSLRGRGGHKLRFEPRLHPRDRQGQFADVLNALRPGDRVTLPGGTNVTKRADGQFDARIPSRSRYMGTGTTLPDARTAAQTALDADAPREGGRVSPFASSMSGRTDAGAVKTADAERRRSGQRAAGERGEMWFVEHERGAVPREPSLSRSETPPPDAMHWTQALRARGTLDQPVPRPGLASPGRSSGRRMVRQADGSFRLENSPGVADPTPEQLERFGGVSPGQVRAMSNEELVAKFRALTGDSPWMLHRDVGLVADEVARRGLGPIRGAASPGRVAQDAPIASDLRPGETLAAYGRRVRAPESRAEATRELAVADAVARAAGGGLMSPGRRSDLEADLRRVEANGGARFRPGQEVWHRRSGRRGRVLRMHGSVPRVQFEGGAPRDVGPGELRSPGWNYAAASDPFGLMSPGRRPGVPSDAVDGWLFRDEPPEATDETQKRGLVGPGRAVAAATPGRVDAAPRFVPRRVG